MTTLLVSAQTGVDGQGSTVRDVARRALPAVVTLETFDEAGRRTGLGSGFIVRATGLIVTNFHVIDGASDAVVVTQSGDQLRVDGVLELDAEKDFAIVRVKAVDLPTIRLGNSERLEPGESVVALGAPRGLSGSVTAGTFSQFRQEEGYRMLQHSAAISPGSSGGPLMLETGEVIGVNTSLRRDANSVFFALPINYVRAALENTDGRVVSLRELTAYIARERDRKKQEDVQRVLEATFSTYRDPEGLFEVSIPRVWQVQRSARLDQEGGYHVTVMAHSRDAQFADINGWLSDGLRISLEFAKKGLVWRQDGAAAWIKAGQESFVRSYAKFETKLHDTVSLASVPANRLLVTGTAATLREPEVALVYHSFHPNGKAVVEFAAPASKVEVLKLVSAVFESTFQVTWAK
jgi:hypothetical protein